MKKFWTRFVADTKGQDLIEYALLAAFVGFAMAGSVRFISTAMRDTYSSWDTAYQKDALVEVSDPK